MNETFITAVGITKFLAVNRPIRPKKGNPLFSVALILKGKDAVDVAAKIDEFLNYQLESINAFGTIKKSTTVPYKKEKDHVIFYFNSPKQPDVCEEGIGGDLVDVDLEQHLWSGGQVQVAYRITSFKDKDRNIAAALTLEGVKIVTRGSRDNASTPVSKPKGYSRQVWS